MKKIFINNYKKVSYKTTFSIVFVLVAIMFVLGVDMMVDASDYSHEEVTEELSLVVDDILYNIDLNDLEDIVSNIDDLDFFESSLKDKMAKILNGEYFTDYSSLFKALISLFIVDIKKIIPFILTIIGVGMSTTLINQFKIKGEGGTSDIIHFVAMGIMLMVVLHTFQGVLKETSSTLSIIGSQMEIVFPLLISLLATIGSYSTISIFNPVVAILTSVVGLIFKKFLLPIFVVMVIFCVVGHLSSSVKLNKFQNFLTSCFKWSVGIVFTLFSGFLSLQGISAGRYDGISIKATKFAVKSYIPIIGGYIAEGMDFLVLGSVLVKNTVGLIGLIVLFFSIISPIINILVVKLSLQLSSAILEMSGNDKISAFLLSSSKILLYPIILILGVAFMYVITVALIMCTANIF